MITKEGKLSPHIMRGIKQSLKGEVPFLAQPFVWGAKKLTGKGKKIDDLIWKITQKPIVKADVALGEKAQKAIKKLTGKDTKFFTEKKVLLGDPKTLGTLGAKGTTGGVEYEIPSITAPVSKAGKFIFPTLGMLKAEEMIKGDKKMQNKSQITRADLQKTAAMLDNLKNQKNEYEKKAYATKLLYKQAELGQIVFPKTHGEYEEKVAELMHKNLNVVEEAIKMAAASEEFNNTFGSLNTGDSSAPRGGNAQEAFQRSLME
jgi:hypothetical protein